MASEARLIRIGHVLDVLREMPKESVHCVVTSPPYWSLRDYGLPPQVWPDGWRGSLGLEPTPEMFVAHLVEVFREVRRVMRSDATCFINLGDSFADKQLQGIPWRVAFALQADGWWLRSDIIWSKKNPMPEPVTDRCTRSHEYIFHLTKSARYFYNADAVREAVKPTSGLKQAPSAHESNISTDVGYKQRDVPRYDRICGANARSVQTWATQPFPEAHFATFPEALPRFCIRAGCPVGGTVLDPFAGSGTTGRVAIAENRDFIGIELNPEYAAMAERRMTGVQRGLL